MKNLLCLIFVFGFVSSSPIKKETFKEVEYDIALQKMPNHRSYFIKRNELPVYEQQFAKIRELGDEINCKITGNCQGMKRGLISKKSMMDEEFGAPNGEALFQDQMNPSAMGGNMGGEDVSAGMMGGKASFMGMQKDASIFGQQPQMDIKMSDREMAAATAGMGQFSNPMGGNPMGGQQDPSGGASMERPKPSEDGNDALLKMQEQQNAQLIDNSVQDKLNFMDKANGPVGAMPGVSDPLNAFPHPPEAKDDTPSNAPGSVTENDLMKAEDIQPSEMKGITNFLKDSNHMGKPAPDSMINDGPSEENFLGKTNVDFGGAHATIDNEANQESNEGAENSPSPNGGGGPVPVSPGGQEVPTLNNLGLGMGPNELGPPSALPNLGFIQDNTRHMIQQNSDYKVPQSALSSLWDSYMSSTQSLLGEKDPSANSRQAITRPRLHRRSNVEKSTKTSINELPKKTNKQNIVYVPTFVIKNVLSQVKKTLKSIPKSNSPLHSKNNKEPALFIREKKGKRYLVINPASPLIQGFANVDNQFASFQMPAYNSGSFINMNGFPAFQLHTTNLPSAPFGTPGVFPAAVRGPYAGMKFNGFPLLGGQSDPSGFFRGFVAVPITTRIPFSPSGFGGPGNGPYSSFSNMETPFNLGNNFRGPLAPEFHSNVFHPPPPSPFSFNEGGYGRAGEGDFNERFNERTTFDNYRGENVNLDEPGLNRNDERQFSQMFGGLFGERSNFERPSPSDFERPSPSNLEKPSPSDFERPLTSDFERQLTSDFERPLTSDFERPSSFGNEMNNRPIVRDYQNYKRSGDSHSHPRPHPYVFTKEHVGFGPITVEAHTASYKGGDPKEDE